MVFFRSLDDWILWQEAFAAASKSLGLPNVLTAVSATKKLAVEWGQQENKEEPDRRDCCWRHQSLSRFFGKDRNRTPISRTSKIGSSTARRRTSGTRPVSDYRKELEGAKQRKTMDKRERMLFCSGYVFYCPSTGVRETDRQSMSREDVWEWLRISLTGGPMDYFMKKCLIHGDAKWIYSHIRLESTSPTAMGHSKLIGRFFNSRRNGVNLNAAQLRLNEQADHIEEMGGEVGCLDFKLSLNLRRALLLDVALSHDPNGSRCKAIEKAIAASEDFMLEFIRQEEVQFVEMREAIHRDQEPRIKHSICVAAVRENQGAEVRFP